MVEFMENIKEINQNNLDNFETNKKSEESSDKNCVHLITKLEEMRRKNAEQFGCSHQQKVQKFEDFEKLLENLKKLEEENVSLKTELDSTKSSVQHLEQMLITREKELDEFKKINTIQENCIENSESEILRLNECLRVTELLLQETVEVSQEIICDLKSKLKTTNESLNKSSTPSDILTVETKVDVLKRQKSKPYFYVAFNQNCFEENLKNKLELRVTENKMNDELSNCVLRMIRQLSQSVDSIERLAEMLTKKLNKTIGKYWNCIIGTNICDNSVISYSDNNYLKCELNESFQLIIFKNNKEFSANNSDEENCFKFNIGNDITLKVLKRSNNMETHVEKFIANSALDAINNKIDDYYSLSTYLRDAISNKYNSQWFVSVGKTKHYYTSWAMAKGRKFMLFEIGDIKCTVGEVGGWLW